VSCVDVVLCYCKLLRLFETYVSHILLTASSVDLQAWPHILHHTHKESSTCKGPSDPSLPWQAWARVCACAMWTVLMLHFVRSLLSLLVMACWYSSTAIPVGFPPSDFDLCFRCRVCMTPFLLYPFCFIACFGRINAWQIIHLIYNKQLSMVFVFDSDITLFSVLWTGILFLGHTGRSKSHNQSWFF
jgi:hypothetical protein